MKKIIFLILWIFFYVTGNALAVEISWMHVQHREYGNGKSLDRLSFGLVDERGNYVTDNRNLKDVRLYDLDKNEMKLASQLHFISNFSFFSNLINSITRFFDTKKLSSIMKKFFIPYFKFNSLIFLTMFFASIGVHFLLEFVEL